MFSSILGNILQIKGWTAYRLAKESGISQGLMSDYVNGKRVPTMANMEKIATALQVPVSCFFEESPIPTPPPTVTDRDIKAALFGGDGEVTDEMWKEVKQFAEFIKEKYMKNKSD